MYVCMNNWQEATWITFLNNDLDLFLPLNGIILDLALDSSCWKRKIPNISKNNINI